MSRTISHSGTVGITLASRPDNPVSILAGVTIATPGAYAVDGAGTGIRWRIANDGGLSAATAGIVLADGGVVRNGTSAGTAASIGGGRYGVSIAGASGTVVNQGTITAAQAYYNAYRYVYRGFYGAGVKLANGGTVLNGLKAGSGAVISGARYGVEVSGAAAVTNHGTILGSSSYVFRSDYYHGGLQLGIGVSATAGVVVNGGILDHSALISAGSIGVAMQAGGVVNYGAIAASGASYFDEFTDPNDSGTAIRGVGVSLDSGGYVTNGSASDTSASIVGGRVGVLIGGPGTVLNSGTISAKGFSTLYNYGTFSTNYLGVGVSIVGTGVVTNGSAGLIEGGLYGVRFGSSSSGDVTVANAGRIIGLGVDTYHFDTPTPVYSTTVGTGVLLGSGGYVFNGGTGDTSATIIGGVTGVQVDGTNFGDVTNYGTITAQTGVAFGAGLFFAEVTNAGTITGTGGVAVTFAGSGYRNTVKLLPGAVFNGAVVAHGTGQNVVELARDSTANTLSGLGTQFQNFNEVSLDAGATWNLAGVNSVTSLSILGDAGSNFTVTGSLAVGASASGGVGVTLGDSGVVGVGVAGAITIGSLASAPVLGAIDFGAATDSLTAGGTIAANIVGPGQIVVAGALVIDGAVLGASATVGFYDRLELQRQFTGSLHFAGNTATLVLDAPTAFAGTISGFQKTDVIDLVGQVVTGVTLQAGGGHHSLAISGGGGVLETFRVSGGYPGKQFGFASDGHGGSTISVT